MVFIRRIKKCALILLMMLGILCFAGSAVSAAGNTAATAVSSAKTVKKGKWVKNSKGKRYRYANKKFAKNVWLKVGDYIYRMDADGYMQTGWISFNGQSYYAGKNGRIFIKRWLTAGKKKYFFQKSGACAKSKWLKINGKHYYFKANGVMARNKMVTTKNKTYYVNKTGERILSTWLKKKGKKYYFNSKGVRIENQWVKSNGKFYYMGADGAMLVSQWVGDFYVGTDGARMTDCYVDGYYLNANGKKTLQKFTGDCIIVGDSRMVGMEQSVTDTKSMYIAQIGAGYDWLNATGGELLKDYLDLGPRVKVILALGVNDMGNLPYYLTYYQSLISSYPKTTFYVMGVGPVNETVEAKYGYRIKNADIEAFNAKLYEAFGTKYLDIYKALNETGFEAWDGLHYTVATYVKLHGIVMEMVQ